MSELSRDKCVKALKKSKPWWHASLAVTNGGRSAAASSITKCTLLTPRNTVQPLPPLRTLHTAPAEPRAPSRRTHQAAGLLRLFGPRCLSAVCCLLSGAVRPGGGLARSLVRAARHPRARRLLAAAAAAAVAGHGGGGATAGRPTLLIAAGGATTAQTDRPAALLPHHHPPRAPPSQPTSFLPADPDKPPLCLQKHRKRLKH